MTRRIDDLDVPLPTLRAQIADLVARQDPQRADRAADRLRTLLAPTSTQPDTTPEEGS